MVVLEDINALYIRGSYSDPTTEVRLVSVLLDIASRQFDYNAVTAI
jgi:Laminin B (Domain IV)